MVTVLGTPFRLGSTSYVWPGGLVANARRLGPLVDDVELVLFRVDGRSNLPGRRTVGALRELAGRYDLTFSVHLPLDLALSVPESLRMAETVLDCTRELPPVAVVLHLDGRPVEGTPGEGELARWRDEARRALDRVVRLAGDPRRVCVENLENYRPEYFLPLLEEAGAGLCVDVGHLWLVGRDPLPFLAEHLGRTRVVHLHGVGSSDHQSLRCQDGGQVAAVLALLASRAYDGVLTLEVFGRDDFLASRAMVVELLAAEGW
jgi:sugar phosphate isomerase/epimerase